MSLSVERVGSGRASVRRERSALAGLAYRTLSFVLVLGPMAASQVMGPGYSNFAIATVITPLPTNGTGPGACAGHTDLVVAPASFAPYGGDIFLGTAGGPSVSDGAVWRITPNGVATPVFACNSPPSSLPSGIPDALGLAFDSSGQFLYVLCSRDTRGTISVSTDDGMVIRVDNLFNSSYYGVPSAADAFLPPNCNRTFAYQSAFGGKLAFGPQGLLASGCNGWLGEAVVAVGANAYGAIAGIVPGFGCPCPPPRGCGYFGYIRGIAVDPASGALVFGTLSPFGFAPNSGVHLFTGPGTFSTLVPGSTGDFPDLEFGPGGAFGTDLYYSTNDAASAGASPTVGNRIMRVAPGGTPSVFMSGFGNVPDFTFDGQARMYIRTSGRILSVVPANTPSSSANFGSGTSGPNFIPTLSISGPPILGSLVVVQVGNSSTMPESAFLGFSGGVAMGPGPLLIDTGPSFGFIGLPGPSTPSALPNPLSFVLSVRIPATSALDGISLYLQAAVIPGSGAALTPGLSLTFGF